MFLLMQIFINEPINGIQINFHIENIFLQAIIAGYLISFTFALLWIIIKNYFD